MVPAGCVLDPEYQKHEALANMAGATRLCADGPKAVARRGLDNPHCGTDEIQVDTAVHRLVPGAKLCFVRSVSHAPAWLQESERCVQPGWQRCVDNGILGVLEHVGIRDTSAAQAGHAGAEQGTLSLN